MQCLAVRTCPTHENSRQENGHEHTQTKTADKYRRTVGAVSVSGRARFGVEGARSANVLVDGI